MLEEIRGPGMLGIVYEWAAWRHLEGMGHEAQDRLIEAIERLASDPAPATSKRLKGEGRRFSLRIGAYRILYTVDYEAGRIVVADVGHRREIYRR